MENDGLEPAAMLQIAGVVLPSHHDPCPCGARSVDIYGYREHDHLRARCTACDVWRRDWVDRDVLGEKHDRRAARFLVPPAVRFAILRRDKHCCVHCGQPAPRSGDAFASIRELLVASTGSERRLALANEAHASSCLHCGQLLPGIFQSIPYDVYADLTIDVKTRIWDILDASRLTMDHLIPHALLIRDGVVRGKRELELVNETLVVTACARCNWGRGDTLERWDEIERVIVNCVLRGRRDSEHVVGYAQQVYFRARLEGRRTG
jgi:5-methylcytosine-specific restriction endonuclease McrA